MLPITRMLQTADTLKYLYMGGRIGRAVLFSRDELEPFSGLTP